MSDIERESFNDLVKDRDPHRHRLAALARTLGPVGQAEVETIIAEEPRRDPPQPPSNLEELATLATRLTFAEMMLLTEGIVGKLPADSTGVVPFNLAIAIRDWSEGVAP